MTRSGPARKQGIDRYKCGQTKHSTRGEKMADVLATGINARMRIFGVSEKDARSPLLGSALGRLCHVGDISPVQYGYGMRLARVVSLQGVLDDVRPAYGVPVLARMSCSSGRDPYDRLDPDGAWDETDAKSRMAVIARIRRDYGEVYRVLWELEATHPGATQVVNRVVMWDDIRAAHGDVNKGALRCGLNEVGRVLS